MPFNSFTVTKSGLGRRLYQAHDIIVNLTVVAALRPIQLLPRCVEIESADLRKVRATSLAVSNLNDTHSVRDSKACARNITYEPSLSYQNDTNGRILRGRDLRAETVSNRTAHGIERDTRFRCPAAFRLQTATHRRGSVARYIQRYKPAQSPEIGNGHSTGLHGVKNANRQSVQNGRQKRAGGLLIETIAHQRHRIADA